MNMVKKHTSEASQIERFLAKIEHSRPGKRKAYFNFRQILNKRIFCIEREIEICFLHNNLGGKENIREITVSRWHETDYLETIRLVSRPERNGFSLERYDKGDEKTDVELEIDEIESEHQQLVKYKFGSFRLIFVFDRYSGELQHVSTYDMNLLVDSYSIQGSRALIGLPEKESPATPLSPERLAFFASALVFPTVIYLYFQNLAVTVFILLFAVCSLLINDAINPNRNPVVKVIQILVYALVFAFIR